MNLPSQFNPATGQTDSLYKPSPGDPLSGVHGEAEDITADAEAIEATQVTLASVYQQVQTQQGQINQHSSDIAAIQSTLGLLPSTGPNFTIPPAITGTAAVGNVLTVSNGTVSGTTPITYHYAWKRGTTSVGTDASTYTCVSGDVGSTITCTVTASNVVTAVSSTSNATAPVTSGTPTAPVFTANPAISNVTTGSTASTVAGNVLTTSNGTLTGTTPMTFAYQWKSGSANATGGGATTATYTTVTADAGATVTVVVTANNASGTPASATSTGVAVSAAADYFDETFTGTNGTAWSSTNWDLTGVNTGAGASATIQTNAGKLTTGSATGFASNANARTKLAEVDVAALVTMTPTSGGEEYGVLAVRTDGTWTGSWPTNGYILEFDFLNGQYKLAKNVGGSATTLGTWTGYTAETAVKCRLQVQGTTIATRVWLATATEPTSWDLVTNDSDITASGYVALTTQNGSAATAATITYDDFKMQVPVATSSGSGGGGTGGGGTGSTTGFVTRSGSQLILPSGARWRYIGFGGYTWMGCGSPVPNTSQMNTMMAGMRPASCFRLHNARSAQAYAGGNFVDTNGAVARNLDNMVQAAKNNGQYVCIVLLDFNGSCSAPDGDMTSGAGFMNAGNHNAWKTWVQRITAYYANEPTVAMYEIINEPRGLTIGSDSVFESFMSEMGGVIKANCPQLVESGMYGSYYSGTSDGGAGTAPYVAINAQSTMDVANVHDYNGTHDPIVNAVGDAGNTSGKPMIVGEWNCSTNGYPSSPCSSNFFSGSPSNSTPGVKAMLDTFNSVSVLAGINVWAWDPSVIGTDYEKSVMYASHQV